MKLTMEYIDSLSPNAGAISSGKGLVKKGSFTSLRITADKTLLFGECAGSGKNPYACSMDFIDAAKPVPRCTCPSRQIPCKHVMGLMYAYAQGQPFAEGEVPESVAAKREKSAKRAETRAEAKEKKPASDAPPTKAKINAAIKRIDVQLNGIDMAQKLLENMIRTGLAGIDARTRSTLETQVKELGNYYIGGIQAAFMELLLYMKEQKNEYAESIEQVIFLRALLTKAREHLTAKKQDESKLFTMDTTSEIEAQIGYVWKLDELRAHGCFSQSASLIQLSFNVYDNPAKREFTDHGYYICTQNGKIYAKKNFRPYKGVRYIARDNSVFGLVIAEELYIYPGGMNPRVRFENYSIQDCAPKDYKTAKSFACDDYAQMAKVVKNQIKTPLADKNPAALLRVARASAVMDGDRPYVLIEDSKNGKQLLHNAEILKLIDLELLAGQAVLVEYANDRENGLLTARPLSIITDDRVVRLEY